MNSEVGIMTWATEGEHLYNSSIKERINSPDETEIEVTLGKHTLEVAVAPKRAPRVHINVGGKHFEIARALLMRHPRTRLGRIACLLEDSSDPSPDELLTYCDDFRLPPKVSSNSLENFEWSDCPKFYFERDGTALPMLLNFYRTGKLHVTDDMCVINFAEELKYWSIKTNFLEPCCARKFGNMKQSIEDELNREEEILTFAQVDKELALFGTSRWEHVKKLLFLLLERPDSSIIAKVAMGISILFILLSTATLVLNTVPCLMGGPHCDKTNDSTAVPISSPPQISSAHAIWSSGTKFMNASQSAAGAAAIESLTNSVAAPAGAQFEDYEHPVFKVIEGVCVVWFTLEFVLRFVCSPQKLRFTINLMNLIDLAAIAPYYVTMIVNVFLNSSSIAPLSNIRRILQILRVVRIFRVLKLARHSTGLQALGYTFSSSYRELGLLVLFLFIGVVSFAALIYFAEKSENGNMFNSIPAAFWFFEVLWALITMTTVGYGDMYPITLIGKMIGSACCIAGIIVIGMPIPFIVNNFTDYYKKQMERDTLIKRKASELQALRKASSNASSHNVSPIASPTILVPPIAPGRRNGTASIVPGNGPTFCISAAPTPAESPVKMNNVPHVGIALNLEAEAEGVKKAKHLLLHAKILKASKSNQIIELTTSL